MLFGVLRRLLSDHARRVGRAFAAALEAGGSGAGPGHDVALLIAHGDDGIVERRLDMRLTVWDILSDLAWPALWPPTSTSHCPLHSPRYLVRERRTPPPHANTLAAPEGRAGRAQAGLAQRCHASPQAGQVGPKNYFFLAPRRRPRPATVFLGPRRVRALVLVRWPRTGRLRR